MSEVGIFFGITCDVFQSNQTNYTTWSKHSIHSTLPGCTLLSIFRCYGCFREDNYWVTKRLLYFWNTTEFAKAYPPRNISHENRKEVSIASPPRQREIKLQQRREEKRSREEEARSGWWSLRERYINGWGLKFKGRRFWGGAIFFELKLRDVGRYLL